MRITFLNPVGFVGGAERVLLAAIRGARDHLPGVRLELVLLAEGPLRAQAERLGASVVVVPLPDGLARQGDARQPGHGRARLVAGLARALLGEVPEAMRFLRRLRLALRRSAPDLIHSNGLKSHVLASLTRPKGIPVLWHLHDFPAQRPIMARLLRALAGRATAGIAISGAVRNDARTILPSLPIELVLNPTDTDHFSPAERDGVGLDQLAGMSPAPPGTARVGIVATYANWKGQDIFLEALRKIDPVTTKVRGYIVGGPIYTTAGSQFSLSALQELADTLGLADHVGFIPFQSDPADVYRMLDIVVHASTRPEPFGLSIVEAMACGKPVIVAGAGGAAELFMPGHDGLSHVPGDASSLALAISSLIADPEYRERLGVNARSTAVDRFSQERYGREIAAIYSQYARTGHGTGLA